MNFLLFPETYTVSKQIKEGLMDHYDAIRTQAGVTKDEKSFDWYVKDKVRKGQLTLQEVPAEGTGTPRNIEVFRAVRQGNLIAF